MIIDHFRPPLTPYGPGNRGVDEQVAPATPVVASADGEVLFAGEVAGQWHVTLRHGDGLRTTYSYLAVVAVKVGQHVTQGTVLGLSATLVHFGVRDPSGAYLDPEALWAGRLGAHLVPGPDDGDSSPQAATDERDGSVDVAQPGSRSAPAAGPWPPRPPSPPAGARWPASAPSSEAGPPRRAAAPLPRWPRPPAAAGAWPCWSAGWGRRATRPPSTGWTCVLSATDRPM